MVLEYIGRALQAAIILVLMAALWDEPVGKTFEAILSSADSTPL